MKTKHARTNIYTYIPLSIDGIFGVGSALEEDGRRGPGGRLDTFQGVAHVAAVPQRIAQ